MATILTNRAFPDSRADLSRAAAQGNVIGFVAPGSIVNQQVRTSLVLKLS